MSNIILYIDGGTNKIPTSKKGVVTYGIVCHGISEEPIEKFGSYDISMINNGGIHEFVALIESIKLCKNNNISFKNVSLYTDAEEIAYHDKFLTQYQETAIPRIQKALEVSCKDNEIAFEEILDFLSQTRVSKVKSHTENGLTIDNCRADYLCKKAFRNEVPISYDKFLNSTFYFIRRGFDKFLKLPFTYDEINYDKKVAIRL